MLGLTTWIEIDAEALEHNIRTFRATIGPRRLMAAVVKANAYGHGLLEAASIAREAGVDWLAVHSLEEGLSLRQAGHGCPILCMGYVPFAALPELVDAELRLTVYNVETLRALSKAAAQRERKAFVHLKLETGTNRQGIAETDLDELLDVALDLPGLSIEGASTHFANIEDTTVHAYARRQLEKFQMMSELVESRTGRLSIRHCASSAATILFPETHFDMVRVGIGLYGLWPSRETLVSVGQLSLVAPTLKPVLTWKTRLAQIKEVAAGEYVGYGCSYKTTRPTRIGVLPVGYSDGYARELGNRAHVLVRGQRARVLGRICMNLFMVDLTDVGPVQIEDEVVLLGSQGEDRISAEQLAEAMSTINYEVVARLSRAIPRVVLRHGAR